ncbi:MAG: MFS transporter [Verrucomicrobiota bacterium]|nr:MFS transporter [Verrucomicrobiota bacterium]
MSEEIHKTRTLWLCTALHAFTHLYHVALIPLYLLIRKDFQLTSDGAATFLVTIMGIAYFLPSYPMGVLADRVSRKKLLGFGLALNALGFIGLSFAPNYGAAVGCLILAGFGGSFYHPASTALIARLFPNETGQALGKVGIGASLGFFVGPIYAGWRAETAGWRQPILELGILGVIGAVLFLFLAKEHSIPKINFAEKDPAKKLGPEKMFATPMLWTFFIAASFAFCLRDFAGMGMATLGSLFLQRAHHFDLRQTGVALSFIYLASAVSNPLFGKLSDGGRVRWTSFLLTVAAITIFIFPRISPEMVIPVLIIYGFFFMASYPIVEAALMESVHDSVRGRVFGFFITIGGLLGNLSHWLVGDWVKRLGASANSPSSYFKIYNVLALFCLLSLIGLAFLHAIRKREKAASTLLPRPVEALNNPQFE